MLISGLIAVVLFQPNPVADLPPKAEAIAQLVEQLADPTLAVRQEAARQLEASGPRILPLLPEATTLVSAAARQAVEQIRNQLERRLVADSLKASFVNLDGQHTPHAALAAIAQQTGNTVHAAPAFVTTIERDVTWQQTPFWTAITQLADENQRRLVWNREAERFELVTRQVHPLDVAATTSGPFRIAVRQVEVREIDDQRLLRLICALQAEPRLQPLFVQWPLRDWSLKAEGRESPPWNPDAVIELPFAERSSEITLAVDFRWPVDKPPTAWSLAGRCTVHLAAGREPLVFAGSQLRRGVIQRRRGITAQIREVRFDAVSPEMQQARVRIIVNYDRGGPEFESHRMGLFHRSAWLENEVGQRIPFTGIEIVAEADGGLAVEYRFAEIPAPATQYRFVYEAPTLLLEAPVEVRIDAR
ncbi:MAG: hypothetical protein SH850_03870 [Planctomycetaceae bacterium]|nr:hypothetical protein [Planctomycetaceae bacterium]